MAEIVNLRRARKAKGRAAASAQADANRAEHRLPKRERDLVKARNEKKRRAVEAHLLEDRDA